MVFLYIYHNSCVFSDFKYIMDFLTSKLTDKIGKYNMILNEMIK